MHSRLLTFLDNSPVNFLAVKNIAEQATAKPTHDFPLAR